MFLFFISVVVVMILKMDVDGVIGFWLMSVWILLVEGLMSVMLL